MRRSTYNALLAMATRASYEVGGCSPRVSPGTDSRIEAADDDGARAFVAVKKNRRNVGCESYAQREQCIGEQMKA